MPCRSLAKVCFTATGTLKPCQEKLIYMLCSNQHECFVLLQCALLQMASNITGATAKYCNCMEGEQTHCT